MRRLFVVLCVLAIVFCYPLLLLAQSPAPASPTPVVVPPAPTEPLGLNATTALGGGALLAVWELVRRIVIPVLFPPAPNQPSKPQPPAQPDQPVSPPNPLYDLLRLLLERLLVQPQPQIQAFTDAGRPAYVDELIQEIRSLRKAA